MPDPKKQPNNFSVSYKIGIDCRLAGVAHSGIGRYIAQLIKSLLVVDQVNHYVLFFHDQKQADEVLTGVKNTNYEIKLTPIKHYTLREQLLMPLYFAQAKLDLLHVPHFNVPVFVNVPLIVTIHDLLWHEQRGSEVTTLSAGQYQLKYWFYQKVVKAAMEKSRLIIVPSETVKQTITKFYPDFQNKFTTIYEGVTQLPQPVKLNQTLPAKFLLYVGNLYPHKNVNIILKALQKQTDWHLVVCGARDVFTSQLLDQAKNLGVSAQITHLGYVTDSELHYLYQQAMALVQPSKSEGFGLTGIEAMSAGCPVIASRIEIFAEVYRDAALFFDADDAAELIDCVKKLSDKLVRQKLQRQAAALLKIYEWNQTAQHTLDLYNQILAANPS